MNLRRAFDVKWSLELSERSAGKASEALREFMVLLFTKETKSEETVAFISDYLYKYIKI